MHPLYDETLQLLRQLIQNACVHEEVRNAETLERFFADTPNVLKQRFEPEPGRVSSIFTVPGRDEHAEPLTFLGHIDVVDVDPSKWTYPPFGAEIHDGKLYGRGSVDMLFITATMAAITREVARRGGTNGTLTFAALADEEARGGLGAKWIRTHHPDAFSWKNCISETGGSHLDGKVVVYVGEKGAAQRRLHVHGDAGHGSVPHNKDSAVLNIARVAENVGRLQTRSEQDALTHATENLSIAQTKLRAGELINVLPSHAWLELDIRTLPGQDDDYVDALLREAIGEDVEIEHLICEPASVSPTSHPLYEAIVATYAELFPGREVHPMLAVGGSDLRFARQSGGVGYGFAAHHPARDLHHCHGQLHAHDEHLHLEDLDLTLHAYDALVRRYNNPK